MLQLTQLSSLPIGTGAAIKAAALSGSSKGAALLGSGEVFLFDLSTGETGRLFAIPEEVQRSTQDSKDQFNAALPAMLIMMGDTVVVVNTRREAGFVVNGRRRYWIPVVRGSYRVEITPYPVALYRDASGTPMLVYGSDWNRVDILNLDSLEPITAAKTLVDEARLEWSRRNPDLLPEPKDPETAHNDLDYFYGRLHLSPDKRHFLSCGWSWGSSDSLAVLELADFIQNERVRMTCRIEFGCHNNRPACWVDNQTIAFPYSPYWEGDDYNRPKDADQLHFFRIHGDVDQERPILEVPGLNHEELYYSPSLAVFVAFDQYKGTLVFSREGEVLLSDAAMQPHAFYPDSNLFLSFRENSVIVHRLE